jgi:hypothetical protein
MQIKVNFLCRDSILAAPSYFAATAFSVVRCGGDWKLVYGPASEALTLLRSAPACGKSQVAKVGLDSLQGFLLSRAGGFMDTSIVCDPDPQHSHGLQMISGVENNRRAKRDYLNGTGMVVLVPHHVDNFFEFGVDEPIFRRGVRLATHFDAIYVEIKAGVNPSNADGTSHRPFLGDDVVRRNLTKAMMRIDYLANISGHWRLPHDNYVNCS